MRFRSALPLVVLLFLLLACQFSSQGRTPASPQLSTIVAGTLTAYASTPRLPWLSPTLAPPFTPLPTFTLTATPSVSLTAEAAPIPQPAGEVTILLMGSDQRPGAQDFRTDTILLVVLKPDGSAGLISFPRDLWVYLPGRSMDRINAAQEDGGFKLVQSTFQYNFGFTPQSYILTTFNGFRTIVDSLGGIDVQVGQTLTDARAGYRKGFTVKPGLVHMDSETALWYVRARKTTSDLDRLRRAQEVILAIGKKLLTLNSLARIAVFYADFHSVVVTDLTPQNVSTLLPVLEPVDPNKVQRYTIGIEQVTPFVTSGGADVLLPRPDAIRQVLLQALGN